MVGQLNVEDADEDMPPGAFTHSGRNYFLFLVGSRGHFDQALQITLENKNDKSCSLSSCACACKYCTCTTMIWQRIFRDSLVDKYLLLYDVSVILITR